MIQFLGNHNLFVSHFIMGCKEAIKDFTKTETDEIRVLSKWLSYKDNDPFMRKYRTSRTQYVDFLVLIELSTLKEIIEDLKRIYLIEFPFSEKEDFIEAVFGHSLYKLETFIENNIVYYGPMWKNEPFDFYYFYDNPFSEFLDYVTEENRSIEYFKQYYKQVVYLIEETDYPNIGSSPSKRRKRKPEEAVELFTKASFVAQVPLEKSNLTIDEVALVQFYLGKVVTRQNCNEIIKRYGHNSGDKLYLRFTHYSDKRNRTEEDKDSTELKLKNKINRFKKVIEVLPQEFKQSAIDDLKELELIYNTHY